MKIIIIEINRYVKKTINLEFVKKELEEVDYDEFHNELEQIEETIQKFLCGENVQVLLPIFR